MLENGGVVNAFPTSSVVNKFSLNISNGCNSDDNPELINANAAVYWPDKFTINNYGITWHVYILFGQKQDKNY